MSDKYGCDAVVSGARATTLKRQQGALDIGQTSSLNLKELQDFKARLLRGPEFLPSIGTPIDRMVS